jgi:predicted signal transduction protein with EAL and GGDEF domain
VHGASLAEVEAVARRVLNSLQEPMEMDGKSLSVRISIGIATSEHSTDAGELLQLADLALYEAKDSFKGTYRIFREELRDDLAALADHKDGTSIRHAR